MERKESNIKGDQSDDSVSHDAAVKVVGLCSRLADAKSDPKATGIYVDAMRELIKEIANNSEALEIIKRKKSPGLVKLK